MTQVGRVKSPAEDPYSWLTGGGHDERV